MSYRSFEDLEVWKKACRLVVDLYKEMKSKKLKRLIENLGGYEYEV